MPSRVLRPRVGVALILLIWEGIWTGSVSTISATTLSRMGLCVVEQLTHWLSITS